MNIDVSKSPFSRFGSYMCFSIVPPEWGHPGLLLRTMHGTRSCREAFRMIMIKDGKEIDYTVEATPTLCTMKSDEGHIDIRFAERDCVRIRGNDVGLRLVSIPERGQYAFSAGENSWHVNSSATSTQYLLTPLSGLLNVESTMIISDHKRGKDQGKKKKTQKVIADFIPDNDGVFEGVIEEFMTTPRRCGMNGTFEEVGKDADKEWERWITTMPSMPEGYEDAGAMALYVNYESVVGPWGNFKRDTMLMSKNWMTQCWSWDHCFNAMACSYKNPDVGWDQLMVHFDLQDKHGVLPDGVHAEGVGWNFCKPPIHGWTLSKMMKNKNLLTEKRLKEIYPKLKNWTNWWLRDRDYDNDGLPEYHHGNDSGWDNSTVYDGGFPVAGADLAAFLILQMDILTELAKRLEKEKEAQNWEKKAKNLLKIMIEKLWDGDQFHSKKAFTYDVFPNGDSLINYLPIVLGKRLPKEIRDKVADGLLPDGRFVTQYGPATESPHSPLYLESGYWRGPIWGPEVVIITDGLWRGGYREQASEIARRYCEMCKKTMTFAENYDPVTGDPLCDKAYTWGSSAYIILAHEFLGK